MKLLGNVIWLVFGGVELALGYIVTGALLCITIIGIPFGWQLIKLSELALWPFGKEIRQRETGTGCLPLLMNLLWIIIGGFWLSICHLIAGLFFCITIIGIPFGVQHFKLAALILTPFGHEVVSGKAVD